MLSSGSALPGVKLSRTNLAVRAADAGWTITEMTYAAAMRTRGFSVIVNHDDARRGDARIEVWNPAVPRDTAAIVLVCVDELIVRAGMVSTSGRLWRTPTKREMEAKIAANAVRDSDAILPSDEVVPVEADDVAVARLNGTPIAAALLARRLDVLGFGDVLTFADNGDAVLDVAEFERMLDTFTDQQQMRQAG